MAAKEWRAAEATFRDALQREPGSAKAYAGLGWSLYQSGQFHGAISAYKQALSLHPNDEQALLRLGAAYYRAEAYQEAVEPLEKYVAARPKDFHGFYYLGHSHFELRQFAQAARALQVAHDLNPKDGLTRLGLFGSYVATGRVEKACGLYPFLAPAAGSLLALGYLAGLAWMLGASLPG